MFKDSELGQTQNAECSNCRWFETYTGVCCNGDSEHRADFRSKTDYCDRWECKK